MVWLYTTGEELIQGSEEICKQLSEHAFKGAAWHGPMVPL